MHGEDDELPKRSALRIMCECGGNLEVVVLPREEAMFTATCAGCGTHYHRQMNDLAQRAVHGEVVTVVLPRSRPRG